MATQVTTSTIRHGAENLVSYPVLMLLGLVSLTLQILLCLPWALMAVLGFEPFDED